MKASSQSLHSEMIQVVDSTFDILSPSNAAMKICQSAEVTFLGSQREKTQTFRRLTTPKAKLTLEAFFVGVFLLCLFLTGCSGSLNAGPDSQGAKQFLQASGEATMPSKSDVLSGPTPETMRNPAPAEEPASPPFHPPADSSADATRSERLMKSLVAQEVVQERVRKVIGWLRFEKQEKTAGLAVEGWARVSSGKVLLPLNHSAVAGQPDLSTTELMLWRQLLRSPEPDPATSAGRESVSLENTVLENMALLLTTAKVPEDVFRADKLLVVSDAMSR